MTVVEQIFPSLTWRIRQLAMYPDKPYTFAKLENDFEGIHFGLYTGYELTGVVSLFVDGYTAQFRKLAVLPASQHQGLGTQLMRYLIDFCSSQNISTLWCNARTSAKSFYENLDFESVGNTFENNGIDYLKMELTF